MFLLRRLPCDLVIQLHVMAVLPELFTIARQSLPIWCSCIFFPCLPLGNLVFILSRYRTQSKAAFHVIPLLANEGSPWCSPPLYTTDLHVTCEIYVLYCVHTVCACYVCFGHCLDHDVILDFLLWLNRYTKCIWNTIKENRAELMIYIRQCLLKCLAMHLIKTFRHSAKGATGPKLIIVEGQGK